MPHASLDAAPLAARARVQTAFAIMLAATLAAGAAGCSGNDSSTGPTTPNVAGEYSLETIQARSVPTQVYDGPIGDPEDDNYHDSYVVTVTGGTMTLEDDRNYHMLVSYTAVADGEPFSLLLMEFGTYEIDGNRIVLTSDYGDEAAGTVRDGEVAIRMAIAGETTMRYVFRK